MPISLEELRREVPCELVQNVLPKELADNLLTQLITDAPTWHRGQWIMFGKTHAAPRTSCYYSLSNGQVRLPSFELALLDQHEHCCRLAQDTASC